MTKNIEPFLIENLSKRLNWSFFQAFLTIFEAFWHGISWNHLVIVERLFLTKNIKPFLVENLSKRLQLKHC